MFHPSYNASFSIENSKMYLNDSRRYKVFSLLVNEDGFFRSNFVSVFGKLGNDLYGNPQC